MQVIGGGDFSGQYKIDSNDFWNSYGWMIESGSDDLLQLYKSKEVYTKDWKGQNGKQYDLSKRFFEDKIATLAGYIIADDEEDFWLKYLSFWDLLKSPGARILYSHELKQTFSVFYLDSPNPKRLTTLTNHPGKIAMKLDIQFQVIFMEFEPPSSVPLPPVVNAGGNRIITLPTDRVTINGASAVPRGGATIVSLLWEYVSSVPTGLGAIIDAPTTITPMMYSMLTAGVYTFRLKSTDSNGLSASNTMSVTVNAAPVLPPPIVNAGPDRTIRVSDAELVISGASAVATSGATITFVSWTFEHSAPEGLSLSIQNANTLTPRLYMAGGAPLAIGVYHLSLTAGDSNNKQTTDEMTLTVIADDVVPSGFPYTFPYNLS